MLKGFTPHATELMNRHFPNYDGNYLNISQSSTSLSPSDLKLLLIYYEAYFRLKSSLPGMIPKSRFIIVNNVLNGNNSLPIIAQEKIKGIRLWDMFNRNVANYPFFDEFREFLPAIALQLRPIIDNQFIDWNIQNIIYDKTENKLWYIDSKPIEFAWKVSVEKNRAAIIKAFINPHVSSHDQIRHNHTYLHFKRLILQSEFGKKYLSTIWP
jgi:hypothetical protein